MTYVINGVKENKSYGDYFDSYQFDTHLFKTANNSFFTKTYVVRLKISLIII